MNLDAAEADKLKSTMTYLFKRAPRGLGEKEFIDEIAESGTYALFAAALNEIAAEEGLLPHQVQAVIWVYWRLLNGYQPVRTNTTVWWLDGVVL
jgi:hypothetical protein